MKHSFIMLPLAIAALAGGASIQHNAVKAEGEEVIINPIADYRFQDATNLGKDSSGNGFDLTVLNTSSSENAITQQEDEGGKYLSLVRDEYENGESKGTGACLYASKLSNGKDWSDLVQGSYTVDFTIKSNNTEWVGDRYAITTGRYNSSFTVCPWKGGVDVGIYNKDFATEDVYSPAGFITSQTFVEGSTKLVASGDLTSTWMTITVSCDVVTSKARIFINGVFNSEYEVAGGVRFSNWVEDEQGGGGYVFCIGAQTEGAGSAIQFAKCCYRNVTVYDTALSDDNVAAIYSNQKPVISKQDENNSNYIKSLEPVDFSDVDLDVTDANKLNNILKNGLGSKKIKVNQSNGTSRSYSAFWYAGENGEIKGRVLCGDAINIDNLFATTTYKYVAKFGAADADGNEVTLDDYVTISDIMLDSKEYVPGTAVSESRHTIKFTVAAKENITVTGVTYNDMDWEAEEDDPNTYYVTFSKGAKIVINTVGEPANHSNTDPDSGDTPADDENKGGCGGSIIAASALVSFASILGLAFVFDKKRKY